jgi:hypothetical protein
MFCIHITTEQLYFILKIMLDKGYFVCIIQRIVRLV